MEGVDRIPAHIQKITKKSIKKARAVSSVSPSKLTTHETLSDHKEKHSGKKKEKCRLLVSQHLRLMNIAVKPYDWQFRVTHLTDGLHSTDNPLCKIELIDKDLYSIQQMSCNDFLKLTPDSFSNRGLFVNKQG